MKEDTRDLDVDVVVVGAGIAGVACAQELRAGGLRVRMLDRGHRLGGRMASRRLGGRAFDLGASYFTVADPDFARVVEGWRDRGLAHPWTDTFLALGADDPVLKPGPTRWGATAGLRSLVEDLAAGLDVERAEIASIDDARIGREARAVVLAMPDPQARRLLPEGHPVATRLDRDFEPVLALAGLWADRTWDAVSPSGRFDGAFVDADGVLSWVADDGRRRGDDAPALVAHSTPELAAQHLEDPSSAEPVMLAALTALLGVPAPVVAHVHRWTFARPVGERSDPYLLESGPDRLVGVCGDGWGETPKVETAWRSGRDLGRALAQRLGPSAGRNRAHPA